MPKLDFLSPRDLMIGPAFAGALGDAYLSNLWVLSTGGINLSDLATNEIRVTQFADVAVSPFVILEAFVWYTDVNAAGVGGELRLYDSSGPANKLLVDISLAQTITEVRGYKASQRSTAFSVLYGTTPHQHQIGLPTHREDGSTDKTFIPPLKFEIDMTAKTAPFTGTAKALVIGIPL